MQYIFLSILSIPFLYINYKIIINDIKEKKIPNKYLLKLIYIIPFFYIYLFFYNYEISFLSFIFNILLTLFISFILYYIWIWSAWDAKYLLVLWLFLPHIWIINIIINISIITIIYLLLYFIWFYFWKCLFDISYSKKLIWSIKQEFIEKWLIYKKNEWWNNLYIIIKWLIFFFTLFISIRIFRIYIINYITSTNIISSEILNTVKEFYLYFFIIYILLFILIFHLINLLLNKIKNLLFIKFNIRNEKVWKFLMLILLLILLIFIWFEFIYNKYELINNLYKIFSIMLLIYIWFIFIRYIYKITFNMSETYFVNISDLKIWDIIDKSYLIKIFWEQASLWFCNQNEKIEDIEERKKCIFFPNPKKYILDFNNSIWEYEYEKINDMYKIVNNYHKKNNDSYVENLNIKIFKTFSFWPYIFIWFITTLLFKNEIFNFIFKLIIEKIKSQF